MKRDYNGAGVNKEDVQFDSTEKKKGKHIYSFEELLEMPCHEHTTQTAWMAMYELFRLVTVNELGVTVASSLLKLIGNVLGELAAEWWPNTLEELEKLLDFKGVAHMYRSEHFCPCCSNRFGPPLEEDEYVDHADDVCKREDCPGMRFKKILNPKKKMRVVPLEQCYFYRLERIFEEAEEDESTMRVLRKETMARMFSLRLRCGEWQ